MRRRKRAQDAVGQNTYIEQTASSERRLRRKPLTQLADARGYALDGDGTSLLAPWREAQEIKQGRPRRRRHEPGSAAHMRTILGKIANTETSAGSSHNGPTGSSGCLGTEKRFGTILGRQFEKHEMVAKAQRQSPEACD